MYPNFEAVALAERDMEAAKEARLQIEESREHAEQFKQVLATAQKRFAALKRVEQRHAEAYQLLWESV